MPESKTHTRWVFLIIVLTAFMSAFAFVKTTLDNWRQPTLEKWNTISAGTPETKVIEQLGRPFKDWTKESAPDDYYVSGYGRKVRAITNKVLIYMGRDLVLYIYLDASGRVEETVIASS